MKEIAWGKIRKNHFQGMLIHYGSDSIHIYPKSAESSPVLALPIPVLGSVGTERIPLKSPCYRREGTFHIWGDETLHFGVTTFPVVETFDRVLARERYLELFDLTGDAYLYRAWNYLPGLNLGEGDHERYKQFCESRSRAFHDTYGEKGLKHMPAGTCVGIDGQEAAICFLAGTQSPDHHENPNQIPAYRYPRQYGPRSPAFARASSVHFEDGKYRLISGTAAVVGHESQGYEDIGKQLEITCDNLELIYYQTIKNDTQWQDARTTVVGKTYLRHAKDFDEAKRHVEFRFPDVAGSMVYLRSDICRKELLVEIELSFASSY